MAAAQMSDLCTHVDQVAYASYPFVDLRSP
jgi:hypothetical protein